MPPESLADHSNRPRPDAFWMPDESGMGGEWSWPGQVYCDFDSGRWMARRDRFSARPAEPWEVQVHMKENSDA